MTDWQSIDWSTLEKLRRAFLDGTAGQADYWASTRDLASYEATFAQRIAWKWWFVFAELHRLGWTPPSGTVLDWGCGSGVAAREFVDSFGTAGLDRLALWDRSALARGYAAEAARRQFPGLPVHAEPVAQPAVLLLSHVLTELDDAALDELRNLAARATCVLWVEPGTCAASRRLIGVREQLVPPFTVVAPCPHQGRCGLLAPGNERHWCHYFAAAPTEAFTDGNWARFGRLAGIDLRSLPLSYLILDRRPFPPLPSEAVRLLGRPRFYKAHALLYACTAKEVVERRLTKRRTPEVFRLARKERLPTLHCWRCGAQDIEVLEAWPGPPGEKVLSRDERQAD